MTIVETYGALPGSQLLQDYRECFGLHALPGKGPDFKASRSADTSFELAQVAKQCSIMQLVLSDGLPALQKPDN